MRVAFNYATAAFIILDNIHFQYNSMMYGLLILSIAYIKEVSELIQSSKICLGIILQECSSIRHPS